jgi:hypothetical protein
VLEERQRVAGLPSLAMSTFLSMPDDEALPCMHNLHNDARLDVASAVHVYARCVENHIMPQLLEFNKREAETLAFLSAGLEQRAASENETLLLNRERLHRISELINACERQLPQQGGAAMYVKSGAAGESSYAGGQSSAGGAEMRRGSNDAENAFEQRRGQGNNQPGPAGDVSTDRRGTTLSAVDAENEQGNLGRLQEAESFGRCSRRQDGKASSQSAAALPENEDTAPEDIAVHGDVDNNQSSKLDNALQVSDEDMIRAADMAAKAATATPAILQSKKDVGATTADPQNETRAMEQHGKEQSEQLDMINAFKAKPKRTSSGGERRGNKQASRDFLFRSGST